MKLNMTDREKFRKKGQHFDSSKSEIVNHFQKEGYPRRTIYNIMQENDNYYSNDIPKCPDSVSFAGKEKYPNKVRVWVPYPIVVYQSHCFIHRSPRQSMRA